MQIGYYVDHAISILRVCRLLGIGAMARSSMQFEFSRISGMLKMIWLPLSVAFIFATPMEAAANPSLAESILINTMISDVASAKNITFIVDGMTVTPEKAAAHLREAFEKHQATIETADQFVSQYGTQSTFTNNPYRVRLANGAIIPSSVFLRQLLASIQNRT